MEYKKLISLCLEECNKMPILTFGPECGYGGLCIICNRYCNKYRIILIEFLKSKFIEYYGDIVLYSAEGEISTSNLGFWWQINMDTASKEDWYAPRIKFLQRILDDQ